jgi:hypothetical protein
MVHYRYKHMVRDIQTKTHAGFKKNMAFITTHGWERKGPY